MAYYSPIPAASPEFAAPPLDQAWINAAGTAVSTGRVLPELAAALGAPPERCAALPLTGKTGSYGGLALSFPNGMPDGVAAGLRLLARQLADACEQERAAEEQRIHWQNVVEQMADIVVVTGPDGTPVYANQQGVRLTGSRVPALPSADGQGNGYRMWRPDGGWYAPDELPVVRAAQRGEASVGEQVFVQEADGSTRFTSWNTVPLHGPAGARIGAVAVGRDMTELRQLQEALERRVQELEGLRGISGLARLGLPPVEFHSSLAERIARLLRAESCVISQWDEAAGVFRPLGGFGRVQRATPIGGALHEETSRLSAQLFTVQPVLVHQAASDPAARRLAAIIEERLGFRTAMGVRLVAEGRTVGALVALRRSPDDLFGDDDSRLLEIVAGQAAQELRSFQEARAQQDRMRTVQGLWELAQLSRSAASTRDFYRALTAHVARMFDADACFMLRYDAEAEVLRPVAAFGLDPSRRPTEDQFPAGPGGRFEAALSGNATVITASATDPRLREIAEGNLELGLRVALGIGLYADGKIVGSLAVARRDDARLFTEDDRRLLEIIAQPLAQEIESYRLRQTLQRVLAVRDAILNTLPDAVVHYDRSGRLVYANPAAKEMSPGLLIEGQHIEEIKAAFRARGISGGPVDDDRWLVEKTLTDGLSVLHERFPVTRADRWTRWIDFSAVPVLDEAGVIQGAAQLYRDITEQVKADQRIEELLIELEASEGRFRSIVNHIESAVLVRDRERILYTNEKYRELFGIDRDVVGITVQESIDLVAPRFADSDSYRNQLIPTDDTSEVAYRLMFELIAPQRRFVERLSSPIRGGDGEIFGRVVEYRDLTRERQMMVQRDEFLERTAYVLRSGLGLQIGELQRLLRQLDPLKAALAAGSATENDVAGVESGVRQVNSEIARVLELIAKLRDLAHALEGRLEVTAEPHDLLTTVEAALAGLPGLPAGRVVRSGFGYDLLMVQGNRERIRQVVRWLLENAVVYSPHNQPIEISVQRGDDGMARVRVSDRGLGLTPHEAESLFTCYYRSPRAQQEWPRGLGVSLYLARALVEQLGGTLRAASRGPMQGTTLVLELPLAP